MEMHNEFMSDYLQVLTKQMKKWDKIKNKLPSTSRRSLKQLVRKGIPSSIRPDAWFIISGSSEVKGMNMDLYAKSLKAPFDDTVRDSIQVDIHRTFPDNIFFQTTIDGNLVPLYHVLLAIGASTPEVGYCQGLNYIAAVLLLVTKNEESSFWLLHHLIHNCLPNYYGPKMEGLITDIAVLTHLVKSKIPSVGNHMDKLQVDWGLIVSKWFLCLFIEILPIETVLRIWDCLFLEGSKILFRVSLTIIKSLEQDILSATSTDELVDCFKAFFTSKNALNCHTFMKEIFKVPGSLSKSEILKLRKKYS